jgi:hypothetical protein
MYIDTGLMRKERERRSWPYLAPGRRARAPGGRRSRFPVGPRRGGEPEKKRRIIGDMFITVQERGWPPSGWARLLPGPGDPVHRPDRVRQGRGQEGPCHQEPPQRPLAPCREEAGRRPHRRTPGPPVQGRGQAPRAAPSACRSSSRRGTPSPAPAWACGCSAR